MSFKDSPTEISTFLKLSLIKIYRTIKLKYGKVSIFSKNSTFKIYFFLKQNTIETHLFAECHPFKRYLFRKNYTWKTIIYHSILSSTKCINGLSSFFVRPKMLISEIRKYKLLKKIIPFIHLFFTYFLPKIFHLLLIPNSFSLYIEHIPSGFLIFRTPKNILFFRNRNNRAVCHILDDYDYISMICISPKKAIFDFSPKIPILPVSFFIFPPCSRPSSSS